jgi:hypothetical protein
MLNALISKFASSESGIHVSLKAEKVFEVAGVPVTNSMTYGVVVAVFMMTVLVLAARKSRVKARKGFIAIVEIIDNGVGLPDTGLLSKIEGLT